MNRSTGNLEQSVKILGRMSREYVKYTFYLAFLTGLFIAFIGFFAHLLMIILGVQPMMGALLIRVLLSLGGAWLAWRRVFVPLRRGLGRTRQAIRLEELSGVSGDLLSALEFHRSLKRGELLPDYSLPLLERVGERAIELLRSIARDKVIPVRECRVMLYSNLVIGGCLLVALTLAPSLGQEAVDALVETYRRELPADRVVPSLEKAGDRPEARAGRTWGKAGGSPCTDIHVEVREPDYLGGSVHVIANNGHFSFVKGSSITFFCRFPTADAVLDIDRKEPDSRFRAPMELIKVEDQGFVYSATLAVTAAAEYRLLRKLPDNAGNQWHHGVWVVNALDDQVPSCKLLEPGADRDIRMGEVLHLGVSAEDDWGLARVFLMYRVLGLDDSYRKLELARLDSKRQLRFQDSIPVAALGAEGGQSVSIHFVVEDVNTSYGPGRCRSGSALIRVRSSDEDYRDTIVKLAQLRDMALDLLAAILVLPKQEEIRYSVPMVMAYERMREFAALSSSLGDRLEESPLADQETLRRLSEMDVRLAQLGKNGDECWEMKAHRFRACIESNLAALVPELSADAVLLVELVDAILNSYLVHSGQQLDQQRRTLSRMLEREAGPGLDEDSLRQVRRIEHGLKGMETLMNQVKVRLPQGLVSGTSSGDGGSSGHWLDLARQSVNTLLQSRNPGSWKGEVDNLARAVDELNQHLEGEYARMLARSTTGFQRRLARLRLEITNVQKNSRALLVLMQDFKTGWEERVEDSLKPRLQKRWREVRKHLRSLRKFSRHLNAEAFLPLERQGVLGFQKGVEELRHILARSKVEEAQDRLEELQEQLRSMSYSLSLMTRYKDPGVVLADVRGELGKVEAMERATRKLQTELEGVMPLKKKLLVGTDKTRIDQLVAQADSTLVQLRAVDEGLNQMKAAFPALHTRIQALLEQADAGLMDSKRSFQALDVETGVTMASYAVDCLSGAINILDEATRPGRKSGVVTSGGGSIGALDVSPGGEKEFRDLLSRMEEALDGPIPSGYDAVVRNYFEQLLR